MKATQNRGGQKFKTSSLAYFNILRHLNCCQTLWNRIENWMVQFYVKIYVICWKWFLKSITATRKLERRRANDRSQTVGACPYLGNPKGTLLQQRNRLFAVTFHVYILKIFMKVAERQRCTVYATLRYYSTFITANSSSLQTSSRVKNIQGINSEVDAAIDFFVMTPNYSSTRLSSKEK